MTFRHRWVVISLILRNLALLVVAVDRHHVLTDGLVR